MHKTPPKVTLKSQIFKDPRTPTPKPYHTPTHNSKSPLPKPPRSSRPESDRGDPAELFQKVCCPNCRYVFKVVKSQPLPAQQSKKQTTPRPERAAQTQDSVRALINWAEEQLRRERNTPREHWPLLLNQEGLGLSLEGLEGEVMRSSTYSFEEASLQERSRKSLGRRDKKSHLRPSTSEKAPKSDRSGLSEGLERKAELEEFLGEWLLRASASERAMSEMQSLASELPVSVQLPAYQKALLRVGE